MRVRFTPEARLAVREKRAWWQEHRKEAPRMFVEELGVIVGKLRDGTAAERQKYAARWSHHLAHSHAANAQSHLLPGERRSWRSRSAARVERDSGSLAGRVEMERPLRISSIDEAPVMEIRYLNAARGGGTLVERLPVCVAPTARLGEELDAIVACSDLQGIVRGENDEAELLGAYVACALEELSFEGKLPPSARTGVILAGDLYSVPEANKRGGYGDVADVWAAFASRFAWVAGVAGNHDDVSSVPEIGENVYVLDGDVVVVDGIRIGGVAGIIGTKQKPGRRPEDVQLAHLERVIAADPAIVVLHEGPNGSDHQPGHPSIRAMIEENGLALTICGHDHWQRPLAQHARGQILNVDARVIVLVGTA